MPLFVTEFGPVAVGLANPASEAAAGRSVNLVAEAAPWCRLVTEFERVASAR